jgi:hypothetical protein
MSGQHMESRQLSLHPGTVAWRLGLVAALLVALNLSMQLFRLVAHREHVPGLAMLTLDGEHNVPALFSTGLLLAASMLLGLITLLSWRERSSDTPKWAILCAGFAIMGLDEALSFHERLIDPMRALLGGRDLGIFFFAWVVPAIVLVASLGLFFLPFLRRLPRASATAFVLAAAFYLGGALGVELVEGWWREGHGHHNAMYHVLVSLEEGMEMAGVILFIRALLAHLALCFGALHLDFGGEPAAAPDLPAVHARAGLQSIGK